MQRSRSALVVAATHSLATQLFTWLRHEGWCVDFVSSYSAARTHLNREPDLLITELELGEYNGLQLALRARASHIPSLVIGRCDAVLERDAEQLGCSYLRKDELDEHRLAIAVDSKLQAAVESLPSITRNIEFVRRTQLSARSSAARRQLLH